MVARAELVLQDARWDEERAAHGIRVDALERTIFDMQSAHRNGRDEWAARLERSEAQRAEVATARVRVEERNAALSQAPEERSLERNDARDEARSLHARLQAVTEARDALEAERLASTRETRTTDLLEQLVADDRTGRVLSLLESIGAQVSAVLVSDRAPQQGSGFSTSAPRSRQDSVGHYRA